jgi:hypothetical protein
MQEGFFWVENPCEQKQVGIFFFFFFKKKVLLGGVSKLCRRTQKNLPSVIMQEGFLGKEPGLLFLKNKKLLLGGVSKLPWQRTHVGVPHCTETDALTHKNPCVLMVTRLISHNRERISHKTERSHKTELIHPFLFFSLVSRLWEHGRRLLSKFCKDKFKLNSLDGKQLVSSSLSPSQTHAPETFLSLSQT